MLSSETTQQLAIKLSTELQDDERIVIRILTPGKPWGFRKDLDDLSDSDDEDVDASK